MSMTHARRASELSGTDRLVRAYTLPRRTARRDASGLVAVAVFSAIGLIISALLALSYPSDAAQAMLAAFLI